jgi:hypothetical protein
MLPVGEELFNCDQSFDLVVFVPSAVVATIQSRCCAVWRCMKQTSRGVRCVREQNVNVVESKGISFRARLCPWVGATPRKFHANVNLCFPLFSP